MNSTKLKEMADLVRTMDESEMAKNVATTAIMVGMGVMPFSALIDASIGVQLFVINKMDPKKLDEIISKVEDDDNYSIARTVSKFSKN